MATRGVYVLETTWSWDNSNTEYATFTVEKPDAGFECLIDPTGRKVTKETYLRLLKDVAKLQNGSPLGTNRLVRLYKVIGFNGQWPQRVEKKHGGLVDLHIRMQPVCDFDDDGNPIPTKQS